MDKEIEIDVEIAILIEIEMDTIMDLHVIYMIVSRILISTRNYRTTIPRVLRKERDLCACRPNYANDNA